MSLRPQIMGILNVTPDSFSDGGRFSSLEAALQHARRLCQEGADVIDIGGESTRPGSSPVPPEQQIERVLPVVEALRHELPTARLSIDTTRVEVAEAALAQGVHMLNDISAGRDCPAMFRLAARYRVPLVLMHMQGTPATMQQRPRYENVLGEVEAFLRERMQAAIDAGVPKELIWLDPGIGFGKRREDNLALLNGLRRLAGLGAPLLLGASRKRFMGRLCAQDDPEQLLGATCASTALGVAAGVRMFRVHDVAANRQAADVAWHISHYPDTPQPD
jgi:dihydropteroate synthase